MIRLYWDGSLNEVLLQTSVYSNFGSRSGNAAIPIHVYADAECQIRSLMIGSDRPGSMKDMCQLFSSAGASVKDIYLERAWLKSDMFSVQVEKSSLPGEMIEDVIELTL